jgi:phytoene/squalene synthetase
MAKPNLADPDFEPTDEQFAELLRRAGDDARASCAEAERAARALVEAERAKVIVAPRSVRATAT